MRLDHVALTVADRDRSADFYGRRFGLTERVHDDEHRVELYAYE
jgi:catechol 2,3-dioxygenase-like lactoylglutathione lyase family enzyme